jgi:hypothetical protein
VTYDLEGRHRIPKVQFPTPESERLEKQWIARWEDLGNYQRLFWLTRETFPDSLSTSSIDSRRTVRLQHELPEVATTDTLLEAAWGSRALWLEHNMPYATVYVGSTEYRIHTYSSVDADAKAVTYSAQIHIQPRATKP